MIGPVRLHSENFTIDWCLPMPRKIFFIWAVVLLSMLMVGKLSIALAQYEYRSGTSYSPQRQPTPRLPTSARHVGGFIGNLYRNDRIAPTGLPVGRTLHTYYGGGIRQYGGGNPFGHRSVSKPFSNITPTRPLITSRDAARIEISRGLWLW